MATCGTALADGHFRLLTNFARRIVLAYDADAAGQAAAERFYEWERRYEVDIAVAALPPGPIPPIWPRAIPKRCAGPWTEARPFLAFRLDRLFGRSDLSRPEGRARAADVALGLVAAHPNELVRDQYLMEVADRCRVDPDRLRSLPVAVDSDPVGPSGAPGPERTGGERRAARPEAAGPSVAIARPEPPPSGWPCTAPTEVADRLVVEPLRVIPLSRSAFISLASADTLYEAIERSDPQTADLLQRLAVEETERPPMT